MPEDLGAVGLAEAPVTETSTETVDTGTETVETGAESAETGNEVDSSVENEGLTEKTPSKGKLNLADVVKKSGDALKAINPALPAALRTAAFEQAGLYREFPGGLKEAVALKNGLGEFGGLEGIKEQAAAIGDYQKLETLFEKGDAAFINGLAEASPASFSQIMPGGLEKWKAVDPEMYGHVQAKVLTQTIDQFKLSETLAALHGIAEGQAKEEIARLLNSLDAIRKTGEKAPERKIDPQNEALTRREQQLAQRETKALLTPIANEGKAQIQSITDREMTQSYQWDKTTGDVKQAVADRVRQEVIAASGKDKTFSREFDRLKERGDSAGLSKHVKNFQERVTPSIVQRVAKLFNVKPKGAPLNVIKKPVAGAPATNGAKVEQGWTKWMQQTPPRADLVDRSKTSEDMILSNPARYVLKDGRRVTWG